MAVEIFIFTLYLYKTCLLIHHQDEEVARVMQCLSATPSILASTDLHLSAKPVSHESVLQVLIADINDKITKNWPNERDFLSFFYF